MLCRSVHVRGFTAGQKTVENQDWATGPLGRWAAGPPGRRAAGPPGRGGPAFSKTHFHVMVKDTLKLTYALGRKSSLQTIINMI